MFRADSAFLSDLRIVSKMIYCRPSDIATHFYHICNFLVESNPLRKDHVISFHKNKKIKINPVIQSLYAGGIGLFADNEVRQR